MAVTKAQLAVWALISGLSVWGCTMLSRVKLPEEVATPLPQTVAVAKPRAVEPAATAVPMSNALPATVPVFPFPDELVPDVTEATLVARPVVVGSFTEASGDAVPAISTSGGFDLALPEIETAGAVVESISAPEAEPDSMAVAAAAAEEPPIPRPARPIVAQPTEAVPLSEVKTLYVVADALNVRAIPSTNAPVIQKLPQGYAVAARAQAAEWIGFVMRDGQTGWMRTDYLSDTMPSIPPPSAPAGNEPLNLMM